MLLKIKHCPSSTREQHPFLNPKHLLQFSRIRKPRFDRNGHEVLPSAAVSEKPAKWAETQGVPLFYAHIANKIIGIR
jgi:hypothetical protein